MASIIIAESIAIIRQPLAAALRAAGHDVREVAGGKSLVSAARRERPDLILMELKLQELSGLDALTQIRRDPAMAALPVIILTVVSDEATVLRARELGVHQYMLKGAFSIDELFRRINALLAPPDDEPESHGSSTDGATTGGAQAPTAGDDDGPSDAPEDPEEALKSLKPVLKRSELAERLEECGELKAMSPIVAEVVKLSRNPNATTEKVAKAIRRDQAIALKILRMANSAAYSSGDPVDSVEKAVIRIGMKTIGQAVMNISVIDNFSSDSEDGAVSIDPKLFWEHSIGCGIIAARLTDAVKCTEPDTAFTLGLLHDVGRLVYAEMLGEKYESVIRAAEELQLPLDQVEKRMLLLNHADGIDRILHQWGFSRDLIDPIVFHHLSIGNIRRMAPKRIPEVATLALANRLAHALMLGSSGNESLYSTHEFCEALRLQPRVLSEIEEKIHDETSELKIAMLSAGAGAGGSWPDNVAEVRKRLDAPFRPIFISPVPEVDSFRMFCERLAAPSEEPPNIGVIHLTNGRDRAPLSKALREAESRAGVTGLPLVILSAAGKLNVEEGLLAGRRHEKIATPVSVTRLITAFRRLIESGVAAQAA